MRSLYPFKRILTKPISAIAVATFLAASLPAQQIVGTWEGPITAYGRQYRDVLEVAKSGTGWVATIYSVDVMSDSARTTRVVLSGSHVAMTFHHSVLTPAGTP